jgi:hypothetical protein
MEAIPLICSVRLPIGYAGSGEEVFATMEKGKMREGDDDKGYKCARE